MDKIKIIQIKINISKPPTENPEQPLLKPFELPQDTPRLIKDTDLIKKILKKKKE